MDEKTIRDPNWYPICCDCQFCGDKFSFPLPNDKIRLARLLFMVSKF